MISPVSRKELLNSRIELVVQLSKGLKKKTIMKVLVEYGFALKLLPFIDRKNAHLAILRSRKQSRDIRYPHFIVCIYIKLLGCKVSTGFVQKIITIFPGLFKDYSRTKLNFQGPPTREVI